MITLLTLLSLSANAQNLSCAERFYESLDSHCRRACEDGMLVECRRYGDESSSLQSIAIVDLSLVKNLHSSQLNTSDSKFVTAYQIAHGAMELDTEIQAQAEAEYGDTQPVKFKLYSKPEPRLVIKKGSLFQAYIPLTFTRDCDVVMGMTGALVQPQGMMLSGYTLMMNKCEVSLNHSFGNETLTGTLLVNALEMESKKELPKNQKARGFFLAKTKELSLLLNLKTYRPLDLSDEALEKLLNMNTSIVLPVSNMNYVALQNKFTFAIKDPSQVIYFPGLKSGFSDISSVQFKAKSTTSGPLFTFKTPKMIVNTPELKLAVNQIELLGDLTQSPTLYSNAVSSLSYTQDSNSSPVFVASNGKVFVKGSEISFIPNKFSLKVATKHRSSGALLSLVSSETSTYQFPARGSKMLTALCFEGKLVGMKDSD